MQYFFLTAVVAAFAQVAITQTIDPNSVPLSTRREHPTSTMGWLPLLTACCRGVVQLSDSTVPLDLCRSNELRRHIRKRL